jgi:hypothetical protein
MTVTATLNGQEHDSPQIPPHPPFPDYPGDESGEPRSRSRRYIARISA